MPRPSKRKGPHGLLLVDKDQGLSSHGVVARARRALGTRTVGHGGTLDPMATGLLVIGAGEGTKLLHVLSGESKAYQAEVTLGTATHTWDAEGEVLEHAAVPALSLREIQEVAGRFCGQVVQRAPAVSAIKRDGEPLYKKVLRGEVVEGPERQVWVHDLRVDSYTNHKLRLWVHCSKGFYVRSLAHDLGRALGTVAHLSALRRERSGSLTVGDALAMATLEAAAAGSLEAQEQVRARFLPLASALDWLPQVVLDSEGQGHALHGRPIPLHHIAEQKGELPRGESPLALMGSDRVPLGLACVQAGHLRVTRGFRITG